MPEGLKTTEFWITALTIICATVLVLTNHDLGTWSVAVGLGAGSYSVSRGIVKAKQA